MRNVRKYAILMVFSLVLIGLFLFNLGREFWPGSSRLNVALARDKEEYAVKGAQLYAENCMQCHGPKGEGVVGMPLNRAELQGDPTDSKFGQTYDLIRSTIWNGRPGTTTPLWVRTPDGHWASYTAMPIWGRENGGPMDEHMVQALTYFIMMGNGEPLPSSDLDVDNYWELVGGEHAPPQPANTTAPLPDSTLEASENARAKAVIEKGGCLACHSIGSRGGKIGPDLTYLDQWGVDAGFLNRWIADPQNMGNENRMPVYWNSAREAGPNPTYDPSERVVSPVDTIMPKMPLSDEERALIVKYLLSPKKK